MLRTYFWKLDHQVVCVYLQSAEQSWLWNIYKDKRFIHASFSSSDQPYMLFYPTGDLYCADHLKMPIFLLSPEWILLFLLLSSQIGNSFCKFVQTGWSWNMCFKEAGWIWIEYSNEFLSLRQKSTCVLLTCKSFFFFFLINLPYSVKQRFVEWI